ncbi:hypothetical protein VP01_941g17 [Puccinia sorghi]|uniref:Uncharacterized protein n=1 Tax=Puccinia sorghi TaxID=27349 RepID=A0A0L6U758_9BASI|nr:hypothetical protein VP01_941g17 [Puccinia sorghi]
MQDRLQKIRQKAVPWDCDGVKGGESSITIILNWLSTGTNYQHWRGDTKHGKTKKLLCGQVLEVLKENGIYHWDVKGKSPKINYLQTTYNAACDWKQNTGAGILESKLDKGTKTFKVRSIFRYWDTLDPIMGSRSVVEPLFTWSWISSGHQASEDTSDRPNAEEADHNGTPTPETRSNSSNPKKKQKKKKRHTSSTNFYMQSMFTKCKEEMAKAQAIATKAKVSYMKELRELGLEFEEIKKMLEKYFSSSESSDDDE